MIRRIGYLKKDRQEKFTIKRAWFVDAWRIVDAEGVDMVQPWSNTRGEAMKVAASCKIDIAIVTVEVIGWNTYVKLHPHHTIRCESDLFVKVRDDMQRQGYDCIKRSPWRDGHMTSAPYYVRARNKKWCIIDPQHEVYDCAETINKKREIVLRSFWGIPEKANHDRHLGSLQSKVGQRQGGADPGLHVGATNVS